MAMNLNIALVLDTSLKALQNPLPFTPFLTQGQFGFHRICFRLFAGDEGNRWDAVGSRMHAPIASINEAPKVKPRDAYVNP